MIDQALIKLTRHRLRHIVDQVRLLDANLDTLQQQVYAAADQAAGFPPDVAVAGDGEEYDSVALRLDVFGDMLDVRLALTVDIPPDPESYPLGDYSVLRELRDIDETLEIISGSEALRLYMETRAQFPDLGSD